VLGRHPSPQPCGTEGEEIRWSADFPLGIAAGSDLYPEIFSTFTTPKGVSYDVSCTAPGTAAAAEKIECPAQWHNPIDESHVKPCVKSCLSAAYTNEQYDVMWGIASSIGLVGFVLNLFVALTWSLGGRKVVENVPYQLQYCVFAGLLFGLVVTLPALLLKDDLACEDCLTEEW
jgi:hypothetical protein